MTDRVSISTTEIRRVGTWALRGLGYPFEIADRAASILEHALGSGEPVLAMLRLLEEDIRATHSARPVELRRRDDGYTLAAQGRCMLEVGPPAIDLVTAGARNGIPASVTIHDTFGIAMIAGLIDLGACRGLDIVATWSCGQREREALGSAATGWRACIGGTPASGTTPESLSAHLRGAGSELVIEEPSADKPGTVSIHAAPSGASVPRAGSFRPGPATVDVDDFMRLYALERVAWAPTSERSFQQAAF